MKLPFTRDELTFHCMNLALLVAVIAVTVADRRTGVQLTALVGSTWLGMLLIVPRIMHMQLLATWHGQLLGIAKLSKWVGLWTAAWFSGHATLAFTTHAQGSMAFLARPEIVIGGVGLGLLLLLALISNKWSYEHIKLWKHLNMFVWALPLLMLAHSLIASQRYLHELPLLFVAPVLMMTATVAGITTVFRTGRAYFDRWRLLLLLGGGTVALLVIWLLPAAY